MEIASVFQIVSRYKAAKDHRSCRVSLVVLVSVVLSLGSSLLAEIPSSYAFTGNITFDISKVPFSRYGSNIAFSELKRDGRGNIVAAGLYLRSMHGGLESEHPVFRLEMLAGDKAIPFQIRATPSVLHLEGTEGSVDVSIADSDRVLFRGKGVSLRLVPVESIVVSVPYGKEHWEIHGQQVKAEKYVLFPMAGKLQLKERWTGASSEDVSATFVPDASSHQFDGEVDMFDSVWTPHVPDKGFAQNVVSVEKEYAQWLKMQPDIPVEFGPGAELAAYVNWTSVVAPRGLFKRPAMLMSKNWMAKVWSWDHCFNSMALAYKDPELAWQQFMVPFDQQDEHGALPDGLRDNFASYGYTKPPIHGWVLSWMMKHGGYKDAKHLAEIYEPLSRWTEWYFKYRDTNGDGLPEYNHGNDSGWDNSTVMLSGVPVETPELSSFLVLQMDALSEVALSLGKEREAAQWHVRADELLKKLLAAFWKHDHFVAIRAIDGKQIEAESLLLYMPIILGDRLPPVVQKKLVEGLMREGRFRTSNGLASEALTSRQYSADGYWLGPIWAPTTLLLAEGLDSMGQHHVAHDLRVDLCKMAQQNGMAENFDAKTGEALRDPAYTWTSSTFLVFAHQLSQTTSQ